MDGSSATPRIGGRGLGGLVAVSLAAWAFAMPAPASNAALNPLNSRLNTAKTIWKVATDAARVRHDCGTDIERGLLPWSTDCSADPVELGGTGTGDSAVDAALLKVLTKRSGSYTNLREAGTPSQHGVDTLCVPASNDWNDIDVCLFQLALSHSKLLFALIFEPSERPTTLEERNCRNALGDRLRGTYRRLLKARTACFKRNGLLGSGELATRYDCMAPAVPPSRGRPDTGLIKTDGSVGEAVNAIAAGILADCPAYLEGIGLPDPLTDPTGGVFGMSDLAGLFLEAIIPMSDVVLERLYDGAPFCGDGTTQADIGEECDDGNRTSCDGCDYNCTLPACGNAAACNAPSPPSTEECDDGDDETGDGCSPTCQLEYCGDGTRQPLLGETCDDGNNSGGDGCTADCLVGF